MYRSLFARDVFAELDRLQREMHDPFDVSPSIRGFGRGGFPALNVGGTPQSVKIFAFAPGLDPAKLEVNLDRGVLTIAGERPTSQRTCLPRTMTMPPCTSTSVSAGGSGG